MAAAPKTSQGPLMRVLDFVDEIVSGKEAARANVFVLFVYGALLGMALLIWHWFSSKDFSAVCTFASLTQTFAFYMLLHRMCVSRSAAGLSSKTLQVYVLALCFRLSATMMVDGYLPTDKSGDWVYQAADVASVLVLLQLLWCTHKRFATTYQAELDTFPIYKLIPVCVFLGYVLHGHLNRSVYYDSMWAIGLYLDAIAMMPQLWMLVMKGGEVDALAANFVALSFASRCMTWWFWSTGYKHLAPKPGTPNHGGLNKTGLIIMTSQSLGLLISADFMFHYFRWTCSSRSHAGKQQQNMVLPASSFDI